MNHRSTALGVLTASFVCLCSAGVASAQMPEVGRDAALALTPPELDFDPPEPEVNVLSNGVKVLYLEDRTLPLVDFLARFEGGYALFDREYYAAGTAMPSLLRTGGTERLPPDSVDRLLEYHALQMGFGAGGENAYASLNTLSSKVDLAVELWGEMLRSPRFDSAEMETWRGRTLESVRRRADDPARLAFSEFNRLMFGDHPTGWGMAPENLDPEDVGRDRMEWLHRRIFCRENMILGVAGDISWERARVVLESMTEGWPSCPEPLPEFVPAAPRERAGVFLIPRSDASQSTVVMAEPSGIRSSDDEDYFASRIANSILGASGFSSRLVGRVRTEEGLAYSVSSLWTAPLESTGIVGALTRTRSDATVAATRLILEVIGEMIESEPREEEVRLAIDEIVNGFVFNFQSAGQIVSRRMLYMSQDLPEDWLDRYLEGIQDVTPEAVRRVMVREVHPDRMTILVVGNPETFDLPLDSLGEVRIVEGF